MTKRTLIVSILVALGIVAGGLPLARAASEWVSVGEANGVEVFKFTDAGRTCYVTTPQGAISCSR